MAEQMVISIEFFGAQSVVTKTDRISMSITDKTTVGDALDYVQSRYPELPLDGGTLLITVNQETASLDRLLKRDDRVSFIPHIGGG